MPVCLCLQFSLDNVNKAGSVVNVERLRWINSRHVRALFADDSVSSERKQAVLDEVLPFIAASIPPAAAAESSPSDLVATFGVSYIWSAMDLMKVRVDSIWRLTITSRVQTNCTDAVGLMLLGARECAA